MLRKIAPARTSVLLVGESGTGKELAARALHELSPRADRAFVAVNCGAIPETLIESELFGHVKGAFTGATADKRGPVRGGARRHAVPRRGRRAAARHAGQAAARAAGAARSSRSAATAEREVDVRVVAATNRDLEAEVEKGTFRQDLYYRLNVIQVRLPPLRERREDIPLLVEHFVRKLSAEHGQAASGFGVDPAAMAALTRYDFPGNVRELENLVERAVTLATDGAHHRRRAARSVGGRGARGGRRAGPARRPASTSSASWRASSAGYVLKALERTAGNRTLAARLLGISFRSMRYRLSKLGIAGSEGAGRATTPAARPATRAIGIAIAKARRQSRKRRQQRRQRWRRREPIVNAAAPSPAGRSRVLTTLLAGLVAAAALIGVTGAALRRALALRATWPAEADALYLPGAATLRALSLGHTELAADLVAARTNVYFGAQLAAHGPHRWLERYLDTALDLDPKLHSLYKRGAIMLVYTGREFSVPAFEAANRILERGVREFPGDWELWFQLGFNLLFEMPRLAGEDDARVPELAPARRRGAAPGDAAGRRAPLAAQPGRADADQARGRGAGAAPPRADLRHHQRRGDARGDPPQAHAPCAATRWPRTCSARPPSCAAWSTSATPTPRRRSRWSPVRACATPIGASICRRCCRACRRRCCAARRRI